MATTTITTSTTASVSAPTLPALSPALYERLHDDIADRGCIVPILIDSKGNVIDGKVRAAICRELGIVPKKIVIGNLTRAESEEWRVALNAYRRHLTQHQVREIIAWEVLRSPHSSDRAIAGKFGVSPTTVGKVRSTVQSGQSDRRIGINGKTYKRKPLIYTATEQKAQEARVMLTDLGSLAPNRDCTVRGLRKARHEQRREANARTLTPTHISDHAINHGDFRDANIKPNSVDLILTDPPWSQHAALGGPLGKAMFAALKVGGLACVYVGPHNRDHWNDSIRASGLVRVWDVIVHYPSSNRPLYDGAWRTMYTPILIYRKGPGKIVTHVPLRDHFTSSDPEKNWHKWQQNIGPAIELIRALTGPGALVVDFFAGSATFAVATIRAGEGRRSISWEKESKYVDLSRGRIAKELSCLQATSR